MYKSDRVQRWKTRVKCANCMLYTDVNSDSVRYEDIEKDNPDYFVPKWQYFVTCHHCDMMIFLTKLPFEVSVYVQFKEG